MKINHLAVWTLIILLHILGFVWYGPLFGDQWMEMVGLSMADAEAGAQNMGMWFTNAIATIIPMYVLAWLFVKLDVRTAAKGFTYGFLISFSFVFLSELTGDMFAQNPYALSWITGGFNMFSLSLAGLVLGLWTKTK